VPGSYNQRLLGGCPEAVQGTEGRDGQMIGYQQLKPILPMVSRVCVAVDPLRMKPKVGLAVATA